MESASSGLIAGINAARIALGKETLIFPLYTMIGSLSGYISNEQINDFQPMGANFGVLPDLEQRPRDKSLRAQAYADRALSALAEFINLNDI